MKYPGEVLSRMYWLSVVEMLQVGMSSASRPKPQAANPKEITSGKERLDLLYWVDLDLVFKMSITVVHLEDILQSKQVKRTPQDSINELIIWKMNLLVVPVTSVKFKSELLHA